VKCCGRWFFYFFYFLSVGVSFFYCLFIWVGEVFSVVGGGFGKDDRTERMRRLARINHASSCMREQKSKKKSEGKGSGIKRPNHLIEGNWRT